jgi:hypothetical protein
MKLKFFTVFFILFSSIVFSQNDEKEHNVIDNKTILIKDNLTAIKIAEPILFKVYGKEKIISQKPYKTELNNKTWIIRGSLKEGEIGGTFLIIIDATNSKIIRLTHGK